jgi:hypothetical protein
VQEKILALDISRQPTDSTCGPTCLHAVYNYLEEVVPLEEVISTVEYLDAGGTLAVMLGIDALKRGFEVEVVTYNLKIFDPSWFQEKNIDLTKKLRQQLIFKKDPKFIQASEAYIKYLELGGKISYKTLNESLIMHYLAQNKPVLTGLSATYLYNEKREMGEPVVFNDIEGEPSGHFVVLHGIDSVKGLVKIADPLHANAYKKQIYQVSIDHLICAILLGIITYDANLLIINRK